MGRIEVRVGLTHFLYTLDLIHSRAYTISGLYMGPFVRGFGHVHPRSESSIGSFLDSETYCTRLVDSSAVKDMFGKTNLMERHVAPKASRTGVFLIRGNLEG